MRCGVKVVRVTLDKALVTEIDRAAKGLTMSRSAFARDALRAALARLRELELERKHREGYRRKPVRRGEFSSWAGEQVWPD